MSKQENDNGERENVLVSNAQAKKIVKEKQQNSEIIIDVLVGTVLHGISTPTVPAIGFTDDIVSEVGKNNITELTMYLQEILNAA